MAVSSRPTSFQLPSRDRAERVSSPANSLVKAIIATGRAVVLKSSSTEVLKDTAPGDRLASAFLRSAGLNRDQAFAVVERAAVSPATMAGSTWADVLVGLSLSDLATLAPSAAASQILRKCLVLEFGRSGVAVVPRAVIAPGAVGWIGEGAAIASRSFTLAADTLVPNKLATLASFSRELFESSQPIVEGVLRTILNESLSLDLDASFFGTAAATADRPAGLLEGLVATPASAAADPAEAMLADVTSLLTATADIAPDVVLVAAVPQAIRLRLRRDLVGSVEVFPSSALTAGTVIVIAPSAVCAALDGAPRWDISREALVHEDTVPLAVGVEGSPAAVAAPLRSLWQTDSLSLRMIFEVSWARRHDSAAAFITGAAW